MHCPGRILVLIALPSILGGCPRQEAEPEISLRVQPARVLFTVGAQVSAGAAGPGELLVAGSTAGAVILRAGREAPAPLGEAPVHDGPVVALALDSDGKRLLSVGGKVVASWDLSRRALIRRIQGPQTLTAAALGPAGRTAFFGTIEGHVLSWDLVSPRATPLPGFACAGSRLTAAQMAQPRERRCPFGRFVEPEQGPPLCAYPVTALLHPGGKLARACREGTLGLLDRRTGARVHYLAGYLKAMAVLTPERLLLGRAEGELRIYHLGSGKVEGELTPRGAAETIAVHGDLIAASQGAVIRLWSRRAPAALATIPLAADGVRGGKPRAVWIGLRPGELRLLLADGRLLAHSLQVTRTAASARP